MENFELNKSLGYLVSQTHNLMRACFNQQIKLLGIQATAEQWGLLHLIKNSPGLKQSEIANASLKDKTNVTRMLDILQREGYILRKDDPVDRRTFRIYITPEGENLLEQITPAAIRSNSLATTGLTAPEQALLQTLLMKIITQLSQTNKPVNK